MNRGLYNNTSAILTINKNMNTHTQNISNVNTVGYKHDKYHNKTFNEVMISYKSENLGTLPTKIGVDEIQTIFKQGPLMSTGKSTDLALAGDGFFSVETENGIAYTRNGSFHVDANGFLVNDEGHYVLGENGRIQIPDVKNIAISKEGNIIANGSVIDKLAVVNLSNAEKIGNSYYTGESQPSSNTTVHQGYLEGSNVDMSQELTDVIILQRLLSMNSKAIQTHDSLNEKIIKSLG